MTFDEANPETWGELPEGYEWRENELFTPKGKNLSMRVAYDKREEAARNREIEMSYNNGDEYGPTAEEYYLYFDPEENYG